MRTNPDDQRTHREREEPAGDFSSRSRTPPKGPGRLGEGQPGPAARRNFLDSSAPWQPLPRGTGTRSKGTLSSFNVTPMKNLLLCLLLLAPAPPIFAQQPGGDQDSELLIVPPDDKYLCWNGRPGRTYFLQISVGSAPLVEWHWMPIIDSGTGVPISHEVGGTGQRGFYRLHYTDEACPPGVTLEDWDTDADGRSNLEEVEGTPKSHPLKFSTSDTGIPDGWAVAHGLDPNDPAIGGFQFGQGGLTNVQAFEAGVQAHPDATLTDFDGDEADNAFDADRNDRVINWKPGSIPRFAIIELDLENPDELWLDDLHDDGTILFTRIQNNAPEERVVIDRKLKMHTFPHHFSAGTTPADGAFFGYGPVLVDGKIPGFHHPGGSVAGQVESVWDPGTATFTPWNCPTGYHDDIRDSRDGVIIGHNWLGGGQPATIRFSPDGTPLPGDGDPGSHEARIEKNGNVVSERGYWRKTALAGGFENRAELPEETTVHSATIVEEQPGSASVRKWNLVAGTHGVSISENGGAFRKGNGEIGNVRIDAVTQQGWALDRANNRIRANGEWHPLTAVMGTPPPAEVEILEILDTGLAVARISQDPEGAQTLALLVPAEVSVDSNRDGLVTFDGSDVSTAEEPYKFWINDDLDRGNTVDTDDWEEDDVITDPTGVFDRVDCDDEQLRFSRDLEDLTRVWIDFSAINHVFPFTDPTVELKVRIQADEGEPVINLYQPVETDGGREYLKNEATGHNQLQGFHGLELCQVTSAPSVVPRRAWETLPADEVVHLLFEGAEEGDGRLIFELWRNGEKVCDLPEVYLRLRKPEKMYETWTVGDAILPGVDFTVWPFSEATQTSGQALPAPELEPEKDYIMFVHGWNMPPWEKERFASAMYKRLWHQGFKRRFGAFRWPTFHGLALDAENWTNVHSSHFDGSEERAWNSAAALGSLSASLAATFKDSSGRSLVRFYAHSMGNVAASEALRQTATASTVHTYLSAQAALSSHVWDSTTADMSHFTSTTPNVYGHYWQVGVTSAPGAWAGEGRPSYMDPGSMPGSTAVINHYNPEDWALSYWKWQINQSLKPNVHYDYSVPLWDTVNISPRFWRIASVNLNFPVDRFEIFSFAAESRAFATGQQGATGGKFNVAESVDLNDTSINFGGSHKGHSAQFRSTIQKRWEYWTRALEDMAIAPASP